MGESGRVGKLGKMGKMGLMRNIPVVECGNAVFDFHGVTPAQRVEFGYIGEFAQGAIGF